MTTPGQRYLVSCWLNNPFSGGGQQFSAAWAGTNFVNLVSPPAFTWSHFQFTALATDTNVLLQFAAESDTNYFGFDDVSVTPVPPVTFASSSASPNGFQLVWNSVAGLNYQIQYQADLAQGDWLDLGTVVASTNVTVWVDTNYGSGEAACFYRLVLLP